MNCCNESGQCKQGHGCPARCTPATPKPADCIKARHCLSETENCSCDADDQPMLPLSLADKVCFWGVLICCAIAFCLGMAQWLGWL